MDGTCFSSTSHISRSGEFGGQVNTLNSPSCSSNYSFFSSAGGSITLLREDTAPTPLSAVCSDTFLSQLTLRFPAFCALVAFLWRQTTWAGLRFLCVLISLEQPTDVHQMSFLGPVLLHTNHCILVTHYKIGFENAKIQSSSNHNLDLVC